MTDPSPAHDEPAAPRRRPSALAFVAPNLITLASVYAGFHAIVILAAAGPPAPHAAVRAAAWAIAWGMLFDLLDGRVARLLRAQSDFGLQLDSLADVISFGLAPAVLLHQWALYRFGLVGSLAAFAFAAAGATRLARFNVLTGAAPKTPSLFLLGLPIPVAAGVVVSTSVAERTVSGWLGDALPGALLALALGLALLMVSTVRFRSFKRIRFTPPFLVLLGFTVASSVALGTLVAFDFVLAWWMLIYFALAVGDGAALAVSGTTVGLAAAESAASPPPADAGAPG